MGTDVEQASRGPSSESRFRSASLIATSSAGGRADLINVPATSMAVSLAVHSVSQEHRELRPSSFAQPQGLGEFELTILHANGLAARPKGGTCAPDFAREVTKSVNPAGALM
jgi:hypothetical protein